MAWRIDEGDFVTIRRGHLIGADVLGDATGLARGHIRLPDRIEQRGLAVVDVAHDGDHRRPGLLFLIGIGLADETFLDVRLRHALGRVPEFLHDQLSRIGVDHIIDLMHGALRHQQLDHVDRSLGHTVGKLLNGDDLGNDHLAHDLVALLYDASLAKLLPLAPPAQGGKRTLALSLVEGIVDRELDTFTTLLGALDRALDRFGALLLGPRILFAIGFHFQAARRTLVDDLRSPDGIANLGYLLGRACRRLWLCHRRGRCLAGAWRLGRNRCRLLPLALGRPGFLHRWRLLQRFEPRPLALFQFEPLARSLKRAAPRVDFVIGQTAGALLWRRCFREHAFAHFRRGCLLRFGAGRRNRALLLLFDHHRFRSAMAEALPHMSGFDRAFQAQRLAHVTAQGLVSGFLDLAHARPVFETTSAAASRPPSRYPLSRRASSARRRLAPPADAAACTTFAWPMAKLNSAFVNSRTIATAAAPGPRNTLNLRSSLATPSSAASAACSSSCARPWSIHCSTLANPATSRPAFLAKLTASASRRRLSASTRSARSSGTETACFRLRAKAF